MMPETYAYKVAQQLLDTTPNVGRIGVFVVVIDSETRDIACAESTQIIGLPELLHHIADELVGDEDRAHDVVILPRSERKGQG